MAETIRAKAPKGMTPYHSEYDYEDRAYALFENRLYYEYQAY